MEKFNRSAGNKRVKSLQKINKTKMKRELENQKIFVKELFRRVSYMESIGGERMIKKHRKQSENTYRMDHRPFDGK